MAMVSASSFLIAMTNSSTLMIIPPPQGANLLTSILDPGNTPIDNSLVATPESKNSNITPISPCTTCDNNL